MNTERNGDQIITTTKGDQVMNTERNGDQISSKKQNDKKNIGYKEDLFMKTKIKEIEKFEKIADGIDYKADLTGKNKDEDGNPLHGVYIRKYSKTEKRIHFNNGNYVFQLEYPIIETKFHSEMLNDYNLYYCATFWTLEQIYKFMFNRILERKRPMGLICVEEDCVEATLEQAQENGLFTKVVARKNHSKGAALIKISNTGKMGDLFDLEALATDYRNYADAYGKNFFNVDWLKKYSEIELSECPGYNDDDDDDDESDQSTFKKYITDNLLSGYSIESTVLGFEVLHESI